MRSWRKAHADTSRLKGALNPATPKTPRASTFGGASILSRKCVIEEFAAKQCSSPLRRNEVKTSRFIARIVLIDLYPDQVSVTTIRDSHIRVMVLVAGGWAVAVLKIRFTEICTAVHDRFSGLPDADDLRLLPDNMLGAIWLKGKRGVFGFVNTVGNSHRSADAKNTAAQNCAETLSEYTGE